MSIQTPPCEVGLSGDLGWHETDRPGFTRADSAVLAIVAAAYFGSVWLVSGLAPLAYVATQLRRRNQPQQAQPGPRDQNT